MKHTQIIVIVLISFLFASCAALPPAVTEARIIDQDSFGFCHAGTGGIKEKNLLASLGSSLARLDLSWKIAQPTPGDFDFSNFDTKMQEVKAAGVGMLAVLGFDTPWLHEHPEGLRQIDPEDLPKWLKFVEAAVTRYGSEVVAFEVWNEPNYNAFWTGTDEDFFLLTAETVKTIKRVAPNATVLVGSVILHPIRRGKSFFKRFLASGAADDADAIAVHAYGMSASIAGRRIVNARKAMDAHGFQGELWVTETGLPTGGSYPFAVPPERQGAFSVKWLISEYAAGSDKIIWYELYDLYLPGKAPKNTSSEKFFGVAYRDLELKNGGEVMTYLMPQLLGAHWAPELESKDSKKSLFNTLYTFRKKDSSTMAIAWSNLSRRKIILSGFPQGAVIYETATGQERQLLPEETFILSPDPVIVTGYSTGNIAIKKGK